MAINEMSFRLQNDLSQLEVIREKLELLCDENNLPDGFMLKINLAMDELFTNIVTSGFNDDKKHWIDIKLSLKDDLLTIIMEDDGIAFDPATAKEPDITSPIEKRPIGGLGIYLVKTMTNSIEYKRVGNKNITILKKHIDRDLYEK